MAGTLEAPNPNGPMTEERIADIRAHAPFLYPSTRAYLCDCLAEIERLRTENERRKAAA